jgi:hypothetical protein
MHLNQLERKLRTRTLRPQRYTNWWDKSWDMFNSKKRRRPNKKIIHLSKALWETEPSLFFYLKNETFFYFSFRIVFENNCILLIEEHWIKNVFRIHWFPYFTRAVLGFPEFFVLPDAHWLLAISETSRGLGRVCAAKASGIVTRDAYLNAAFDLQCLLV